MIANPYWDEVKHSIVKNDLGPGQMVRDSMYDFLDTIRAGETPKSFSGRDRMRIVNQFQLTVTDPDLVRFLVRHAGPAAIDPMAGTGYLADLLNQHGVDTLAYDLAPRRVMYGTVRRGHGPFTVKRHGADRTLILSWPPMHDPIGEQILRAYRGNKVIYIGEWGDSCGSPGLFSALDREWLSLDEHHPIRWHQMHDIVRVFVRPRRSQGLWMHLGDRLTRDPNEFPARVGNEFARHADLCLMQTLEEVKKRGADPATVQNLLWMIELLEQPGRCDCPTEPEWT